MLAQRDEAQKIRKATLKLQTEKELRRKQEAKAEIESRKRKRVLKTAADKKASIKKSIDNARKSLPTDIETVSSEMGTGSALAAFGSNIGKQGVGTAKLATNLAKAGVKSVAAIPALAKAAKTQRKTDVESGEKRKLGSRLGLRRNDEYSRKKKLEKSKDKVQKEFDNKVKSRAKNQKAIRDAKKKAVLSRAKSIADSRKNRESAERNTAIRSGVRKAALLGAKAIGPSSVSRTDQMVSGAKRGIRAAALRGARRIGYQSEEFIYEVENMKKDKVDKVIDIMRGKNKIEVMPKESNVRESVKIEDANGNHYAEFIDIIKPEPLKASKGIGSEILDEKCWVGYKQKGMKKKGDRMVPNCVKEGQSNWRHELGESAAWTRKEGKAKSGGLNEKGRKSYERENPGSDLKAPSKKVGNKRRASFCARMKGMKKKLTSKKTASDPNSRINKSLRAWNC